MNDPDKKRTISFYMSSEVKGEPKLILKEIGSLFVEMGKFIKSKDLKQLQVKYPLAFKFVEMI